MDGVRAFVSERRINIKIGHWKFFKYILINSAIFACPILINLCLTWISLDFKFSGATDIIRGYVLSQIMQGVLCLLILAIFVYFFHGQKYVGEPNAWKTIQKISVLICIILAIMFAVLSTYCALRGQTEGLVEKWVSVFFLEFLGAASGVLIQTFAHPETFIVVS